MSGPPSPRSTALAWLPFLLLAALGIFLRVHSFDLVKGVGFDENIYSIYVQKAAEKVPWNYPGTVDYYIKEQKVYPIGFLPPTRITFILSATMWWRIFGGAPVESVRAISCLSSILVLLLSCAMSWRMRGGAFALGVLALMAVAPTQIYIAHRALIDGFFALISLITLALFWEMWQRSRPAWYWIGLYGLSIVLLILTKENAAFVYFAMIGLLLANRWLQFGTVSKPLLITTLVSPLIGAVILAAFCGGFGPMISVFSMNTAKSLVTPYAIAMGDGPWFRYLTDLILVSPAVMIFAIGGAFSLHRDDRAGWFLLLFIVLSYLPMCNVPYGMNLRYANMWDFPLRYLALVPVFQWSALLKTPSRRTWLVISVVFVLMIFELTNYLRIFASSAVYDPVPGDLMKALDMIKQVQQISW